MESTNGNNGACTKENELINKYLNCFIENVANIEVLSLDVLRRQVKEPAHEWLPNPEIMQFQTLNKMPDLTAWTLIVWKEPAFNEVYIAIVKGSKIEVESILNGSG